MTDRKSMRLGRIAPTTNRLSALPLFPDYASKLPPAPPSKSWAEGVKSWLMLGNDKVGNCVIPGTMISGPRQTAGYHTRYSGDVVTISLASGKRLTVTANHRVLTDKGFAAAKAVKNGDYLVSTSGSEILPGTALRGREADFDHAPAAAEEKFQSLRIAVGSSIKVMPVAVDFHGDGEFLDCDIDVVAADRFLGDQAYAALRQPYGQRQVGPAGKLQRSLHGPGATLHRRLALAGAADRDVGFGGERTTILDRHAGVAQAHSLKERAKGDARLDDRLLQATSVDAAFLGEGLQRFSGGVAFDQPREIPVSALVEDRRGGSAWPSLNASFIEAPVDGLYTDPHLARELIDGMPGFVAPDRVVNVETQFWSGHVYDFSTDPQWYVANGVVTHNCTIATVYHLIMSWLAANGKSATPTDEEVLAVYSAVTGYTPTDPNTDQGAVMIDVLNHWRTTGVKVGDETHKLAGFARCRVGHHEHIKSAINLMGGVCLGVAFPDAWFDHDVWDVGRGPGFRPDGGHEIPAVGYSPETLTIVSWGRTYEMTWAALDRYCEEVQVPVAADWADSIDGSPSGFDLATLLADMGQLRSPAKA